VHRFKTTWKLFLGALLIIGGLFAFIHPYYNVVLWTFFFGFAFILWFAYGKKKEGSWSGLRSLFRKDK
jgi:uncharacterized membrane protein HdeD (DUF308 family)